jgi:hypothetical protein
MTPQVSAIGLGGYFTAGSGSGEWDAEDEDDVESDFETDDTGSGFGFVLDTAVAKNRVFNYRLNLGFERKDYEFESGDTLEIDNFVVVNDFGFGVVRTPQIRFWLGPELKITSGSGYVDDDEDFEVDLVSVGIGPVLGLNVHVGKLVTLGFKTGLLFESIVGQGEHDTLDDTVDFTGDDTYFYFSFAVIFRINDAYKKK